MPVQNVAVRAKTSTSGLEAHNMSAIFLFMGFGLLENFTIFPYFKRDYGELVHLFLKGKPRISTKHIFGGNFVFTLSQKTIS